MGRRPTQPTGRVPSNRIALGLATALLAIMAVRTLLPLWLPLLLAAWFADLAHPFSRRLALWLGGKARAASVAAVLLVVLTLSPVALVVLSLAGDAAELTRRVLESESVEAALNSLMAPGTTPRDLQALATEEPRRIFNLIREGGSSAYGFASTLAGATVAIVIGLVVFVTAFYVFLVDGSRLGAWLSRNVPLTQPQFQRFSAAFYETGRGLIIGVGLAALLQGAIAAVGYIIVGLPHAFVLGLLTAVAALVPSVGSGLVWLPIAAVLAFSGRITDAIVVFAIGSIAGAADNVLRPALSRVGRLHVPTFVLFCAMLGGVVAFGASGIILGPLFVRLAMEGLQLWRKREARDPGATQRPRNQTAPHRSGNPSASAEAGRRPLMTSNRRR